jgi:protein involved in sex pheromone biosynthesis
MYSKPIKYKAEKLNEFKENIKAYVMSFFIYDEEAKRYFLLDKTQVPTVTGVCIALGMCKQSFYNYGKEEEHAVFHDTVMQTRLLLEEGKLQAGSMGNNFMNFLMARSPDEERYIEKQVIEQTNINTDMTEDEKAERIARLRGK